MAPTAGRYESKTVSSTKVPYTKKEENIHGKHNEIENLSVKNKYADKIKNFLSSLKKIDINFSKTSIW